MIKLSARITGIPQMQVNLKKMTNPQKVEQLLEQAAILVEAEAKRMCPVMTGRLQQSITHRKKGALTQEIIAGTEYASAIEYGTTKLMVGSVEDPLVYTSTSGKYPSYRPFLRPALYRNMSRIKAMFSKQMSEK